MSDASRPDEPPSRRYRIARLIALGLAVGSAIHFMAFVLIGFGVYLYGPAYPTWRHPVMATADAVIAGIASRRPQWLVVALLAWVIEQTLRNGGCFAVSSPPRSSRTRSSGTPENHRRLAQAHSISVDG